MLKGKILFVASIILPLMIDSDSRLQESQKLLAQADRLAMLYNWAAAAPLYAQAESLFTRVGDRTNALAARFGFFEATADSGVTRTVVDELAICLQDPLVQANPRLALRGLVAKAVLDRNANEISARESWKRILDLATILGDKSWQARAKAEIGQILYMDGNIQSAIGMIRDALISQYLRFDLGAAIHYSAMVGNGAVEAGRAETGLEYCNIALKTAFFVQDIGFPYLAYQGKARALIALHRNRDAEAVLNEALARAREEHNYLALSQLLIVAGTAAASTDHAKAIADLREAVEVSQAKGFNHIFAWSTSELASIYRDAGNLDEAELLASRAIRVMRSLEDRFHLPEHLALLADVETKRGEFEQADNLYNEATDLVDALLVNVNSRQLKSSLIATLSEAYVGHFQLAAIQFRDVAKAYEIIEKARGRSLADTLRGDSETISSVDEISVDAQKDINRIQLAILHETDANTRQSLFDQLFAAEQLLARQRKVSPLFGSGTKRWKPLPLAALQRSLHSDEMLLEYVLSEPHSYCLLIGHNKATITVLAAGKKHIEDLVENYVADVRSRRLDIPSSKELFSVLLQPAIAQEPYGKVIVVPDGKLNLLPFDALKDQYGKYILASHVVTYAPSASVLQLLRTSPSREQARMSFLGVGDVVYSGPAIMGNAGGESKGHSDADFSNLNSAALPNLPGTREELTGVAEIVKGPTQILLEKDATESAFKALPLADFRIIHLAVHGIADKSFPDRAALVLASASNSQEDGLLQAREIRDLPLNADLVTLTACDTGTGSLLGQEGIASLESAFLLAGAKAVIASLWTADDISTISLMKRLYRNLAAGQEKGAALQQAKLDLIREFGDHALPVYWAGFTLDGDGSTAIFK